MSKNDIPQYILSLRTDTGVDFLDLYQQGQRAIDTLTPDKYNEVAQMTKMLAQREFQEGKLEQATKLFFTILQLSVLLNDIESQVITLSNLGIMFQNVRVYDVAISFATEGYDIASDHQMLELQLKALQVLSLIYTNQQDTKKHIETLEKIAEIHGLLGENDKKAELEKQIDAFKQFLSLLRDP